MKRFRLLGYLVLLAMASGWHAAVAEYDPLVVIVSAQGSLNELNRSELVHLYMGRLNRLPSGLNALPLDLAEAREVFYQELVNKPLSEINAYWARLVFSGRASPPRTIATVDEMLDIVASNPGAIGYIHRADVDERVRVVMEISSPAAEP